MTRSQASVGAIAFTLAGGVVFMASLVYFVAVYLGFPGPFSAPAPVDASVPRALLIDVALFSAFALHHSLFARLGLKAFITRVAPPALERSIYVWISSVLFLIVAAAWQPIPGVAWHVDLRGGVTYALIALQLIGVVAAVRTARRLDVLALAGVRQILAGRGGSPHGLETGGPYAFVRHPIYFAWLLFVWPVPFMNGTRLVFAAVSTIYLVLATPFEERDLTRTYGAEYDAYARRVRWRILPWVY
jgi:methanethiol S-methyltransferase